MSHAGASGGIVDALLASGSGRSRAVDGLVLAATGNGTLHHALEAAALRAQAAGIAVLRATRCARAASCRRPSERLRDAGALTPGQGAHRADAGADGRPADGG